MLKIIPKLCFNFFRKYFVQISIFLNRSKFTNFVLGYWYDKDGAKSEGHRQFLTSVKNEKRRKVQEAEEKKKEHEKFAPCNVKAVRFFLRYNFARFFIVR